MMAAGNNSGSSPIYPAAYATQFGMAIGAIDSTGALASFSNRAGSTTLDYVTAAGVNVYSTSPGNAYRTLSGTSMATPVMAGAMALLMQANKASGKDLSLAQLETLFTSTARNSLTAGTATTSSGNSTSTASIQGIGQEALVTTEVEKPVIAATAPEQSVAHQGSRKVQASDWQSAFRTSYGTTIATHPARQVSTTPNTRGAVVGLAEIQFSVDRSSSTTIAADQSIMAISTVATAATLDAAFSRSTGAEALIDPLTGLWNQPWRVLRA